MKLLKTSEVTLLMQVTETMNPLISDYNTIELRLKKYLEIQVKYDAELSATCHKVF